MPCPETMPFLRSDGDATLLSLRLTPRGGRDSLDGPLMLSDGRVVLSVRVRALPESGAANAALILLVRDALGLSASAVSIVSGAGARLKTLRIGMRHAAACEAFLHVFSAERT